MKTIVTGGAGFIGSHLVDRLLRDGHEVMVLDNLSTGRLDNLVHHAGIPDLRTEIIDISDYDKIAPLFKGIDWVFHLAALADIVPSIERPLEYHHSNVDGTVAVLEASRKASVKRFIYAASSSCYGIPIVVPTPETGQIQTKYPYALTKYMGEVAALHWCHTYRMPVVSLRFFNVYGPRSRTSGTYGAVFGVFLAQKLAGKPFTIVGDGTQTRDFTFVTDVVDACIRAADSHLIAEILNVGSGNTYSVNHLVKLLEGPVAFIPKRPGEPDCTYADISKIGRLLQWRPQVSFEVGVQTMLSNIAAWKDARVWTPEEIAHATSDWFKYLAKD